MRAASVGGALAAILVMTTVVPAVAAQAARGKADGKNSPVTLSGCVGRSGAPQDPLTFADASTGEQYRLTGRGLKQYAGRRVEIVGGTPVARRFSIRGGLYPSPNVAAQAGAIDPGKAAIARMPGGSESAAGVVDLLPEFKVTRVRVLDGSCQ